MLNPRTEKGHKLPSTRDKITQAKRDFILCTSR